MSRTLLLAMVSCSIITWFGSPRPTTQDESATPVAAPAPVKNLSDEELAIWNDPKFRRQFIESYMAETEIEPKVTQIERDAMQQILDLIASDRTAEAITAAEAQRGGAASAVYDFTAANLYFQQENFERALLCYGVAVEKFPKFRRAWKNMALIYVRQTEFQKAIKPLIRVIELGGTDSITYGLLGYCHSNVSDFLSAESAYRTAIMLDPETMDWKMGLARSLFKLERYADAAALCRRLIEDQPERIDLWLLQANAYLGLGQPRRAAENYELIDRMGKSTIDSLNTLADIYVNDELFDLAVDAYVRAMLKENGTPDRALRAARVMAAKGALQETRKLAEAVSSHFGLKLSDDLRKELLKLRARLAVADGASEDEVRILEEIVTLDPLDGEALILLGQHSGRSGNAEKAIFYYERAAALESFEADAKVRHAQLLVSQSRYSEALPLLRRAQAIKPRENIQSYLEQVERAAK